MTPLREYLADAVANRLRAEIPDVPVERQRRAEVGIEEFPRLIVRAGDVAPNAEVGFEETQYRVGVEVRGYARAPDGAPIEDADTAASLALSLLHARVITAIVSWQPEDDALTQVLEAGVTEFITYDLDESAEAAGEFSAPFDAESMRPTGHLYVA